MRPKPTTEERFWAKVDRSEPAGCWPWLGAPNDSGYGRLRIAGQLVRAHRLSYELAHGPIPDDLVVRHTCDNPSCVNPQHLIIGTVADNAADMVSRDRQATGERHGMHTYPERRPVGAKNGAKRHPERLPRGEHNGQAVLSVEDVRAIRAAYAAGGIRYADLATRYGVGKMTVCLVVRRKTWAHID